MNEEQNRQAQGALYQRKLRNFSILYGMFVFFMGAMMTSVDLTSPVQDRDHEYSIFVNLIGMAFLVYLHVDIQQHKKFVVRYQNELNETVTPSARVDMDSVSVTTTAIFNANYENVVDKVVKAKLHAYKFATGKHAGNFYLKFGMIGEFCERKT